MQDGLIFGVFAHIILEKSNREIAMKKIIGIIIGVILLTQACTAGAVTKEELDQTLAAKSALLMDAESGRVLYEKNGDQPMKNASTTKILTCIVALEEAKQNTVCTVSDYAASMPKVHLGMRAGQQFALNDLLYSLMLESHNDSAAAIAEGIAGSVEQFAVLMNEKAEKIGAKQTHFVTPNGLDADGHETTARDLAVITRYALQNPRFVKIINTPEYSFQDLSGENHYSVYNRDAFLSLYDGAYGVKTGFTGGAGYCFVGASRKKKHNLISVVLASGWPPHKTWKWQDTKKLMEYGRGQFTWKTVLDGDEAVQSIPVTRGQEDTLHLTCDSYKTLVSEKDDISLRFHIPKEIEAPVQKGQKVAEVRVVINGATGKKIPILAAETVRKITFPFLFRKVLRHYLFDNR